MILKAIAIVFFNKKNMASDLNMSHEKMSDFVSYPLFLFTLVIKLINVVFNKFVEILSFFFEKKNDVRFEYVLSNSV